MMTRSMPDSWSPASECFHPQDARGRRFGKDHDVARTKFLVGPKYREPRALQRRPDQIVIDLVEEENWNDLADAVRHQLEFLLRTSTGGPPALTAR
jgi:hypothetical protein